MDKLSAKSIQDGLPNHVFGKVVHYYEQIDSTNNELTKLASQNAVEGTLVIADYQTNGRGLVLS